MKVATLNFQIGPYFFRGLIVFVFPDSPYYHKTTGLTGLNNAANLSQQTVGWRQWQLKTTWQCASSTPRTMWVSAAACSHCKFWLRIYYIIDVFCQDLRGACQRLEVVMQIDPKLEFEAPTQLSVSKISAVKLAGVGEKGSTSISKALHLAEFGFPLRLLTSLGLPFFFERAEN